MEASQDFARAEQPRLEAPALKRINILGVTGTIGQNTLDLIARDPDAYQLGAITAHRNVADLASAARQFKAELAVIADPSLYKELKAALAGSATQVAAGPSGMVEAGAHPAEWTMGAIVGIAGLKPTLAAVQQGHCVALANKECLVSAGEVFMQQVAAHDTVLLPVDSEHAAVFQAIGANPSSAIEKITLTASGGPFRRLSKDEMKEVTPHQALKHPNWSMGRKITIDSATMMNKGLELIEAYHLFPVEPEQLDVIIHPQSIVHCLVEFTDRSVLAQMSSPDMRTPIAFALGWPQRIEAPTKPLDLIELARLDFEAPDLDRFPALRLAREVLKLGGGAPAVMNAANEVAVAAFLAGEIGFLAITALCEQTLEAMMQLSALPAPQTLDDVFRIDQAARRLAREQLPRFAI